MRRVTWLLIATALLGGCTASSTRGASAGHWTGLLARGDRPTVPELLGETLSGQPLATAHFSGKVVVVNFWASWCSPCRAEAPVLREAASQTRRDGVQFIGVNIKNDRAAALAFERSMAPGYPSLYDQSGTSLLRLRKVAPQSPPSTLLVDRDGRFAGRFTGTVRLAELVDAITRLAAEPKDRRG